MLWYSVQQHGILFSKLALILYSALVLLFSCLVFFSVL
jgi:hypothetical protein